MTASDEKQMLASATAAGSTKETMGSRERGDDDDARSEEEVELIWEARMTTSSAMSRMDEM